MGISALITRFLKTSNAYLHHEGEELSTRDFDEQYTALELVLLRECIFKQEHAHCTRLHTIAEHVTIRQASSCMSSGDLSESRLDVSNLVSVIVPKWKYSTEVLCINSKDEESAAPPNIL
jgi:hypothetical protein